MISRSPKVKENACSFLESCNPLQLCFGTGFDFQLFTLMKQIIKDSKVEAIQVTSDTDFSSPEISSLVFFFSAKTKDITLPKGNRIPVKKSTNTEIVFSSEIKRGLVKEEPSVPKAEALEQLSIPETSALKKHGLQLNDLKICDIPNPPIPLIFIGNRYLKLFERSQSGSMDAHDWVVYVQAARGENLIEKVTFKMHSTMQNRVIERTTPPYEVKATTWGWFPIPVTIFFKPYLNKAPLHYRHPLSLAVLRGSESVHEVFW